METGVLQFVIGVLVFVRVTSALVLAPGFGNRAVPPALKVALGVFLALVLQPLVAATHPSVDIALGSLLLLALKEAAVGLAIGFATGLVFQGVLVAGDLMGFDLGLSLAMLYDPETGTSNNVVAQLLSLTALMVFFILNGHHFVLEALHASYGAVPLGGVRLTGALQDALVTLTGMTLAVGIKLAAPVIVTSFLINIGLAVLARVAPQINVFFVTISLKTGAGLFVLLACAPMGPRPRLTISFLSTGQRRCVKMPTGQFCPQAPQVVHS
jgi:flagellar biosynthetic protein FliR